MSAPCVGKMRTWNLTHNETTINVCGLIIAQKLIAHDYLMMEKAYKIRSFAVYISFHIMVRSI